MITVYAALLLVALLAFWMLASLISLNRLAGKHAFDPDWLDAFTAAKYRPMLRLLATDDYEFLSLQPGDNGRIVKNLRAERRRIFRAYLRNLVVDFERLYRSGKAVVAFAQSDRTEFATQLFRQRALFYRAVLGVQCSLFVHMLTGSAVDARRLVSSVEQMRESLGGIMSSPQVIGATA